MSFASELGAISRVRQDVVVLKLDTCSLTWGVAPCTASTGDKCYNTYISCDDKPNFAKATKSFCFTNAGARNFNVPNALPYIVDVSDLPTEIKENGTVTKRLKVKFADEPELTDVAQDKYYADRLTIQGSFWQKLVARNPNYKGRIIELYEGFSSLAFGDYTLRFAGKIENITLGNGYCEIEAVDLLRSLEDIEFPAAMNVELAEKMYRMFKDVTSQAEMLTLPAEQYDWAIRTDYGNITVSSSPTTSVPDPTITTGTKTIKVYAYNAFGRPIGYGTVVDTTASGSPFALEITFSTIADATSYRIFASGTGIPAEWSGKYMLTAVSPQVIGDESDDLTTGTEPTQAHRNFELTGTDPTDIGDWTIRTDVEPDINVNDASKMDSSGYFQIDDEVIFYNGISSNTLQLLQRGMLETSSETTHENGTQLYAIAAPAAGNPFQMLQDLLTLGGVATGYIASTFTTLEAAWTGIDFSFLPYSKKKKLSEIYFNAVEALNCVSWVGEDGKITIKDLTATTSAGELNDTEHIISGSISRDLNEESRYTRWMIHWGRFDGTKDIDDIDSYQNTYVLVDADAESANLYNDRIDYEFFGAFISDTGNGTGEAQTFVEDLAEAWQTRTKQAQELVTLSVELKDSGYKVGDVVTLTTTRLQDIHGLGYSAVKFLIIKKEPQGGRIKLTMRRVYE